MPDDPILTQANEQNGPGVGVNPAPTVPASAANGTPGEPAVTRAELAGMFKEFGGQLVESFRQSQPAPQTPARDSGPSDEDAFAEAFYKAPRATIQAELSKMALPLVAQTAEIQSQLLIDSEKAKIETKFGPGTWEKIYEPKLGPVFAHLQQNDPAQLMNKRAIENAFKTVTGENLDALVEAQIAWKKTQTDAGERQRTELQNQLFGEMGNMTGGFRTSNKTPNLTEEHKEIIRDMAKADGVARSPEVLALAMNSGNTLEEYRAAKKAANGKGKN